MEIIEDAKRAGATEIVSYTTTGDDDSLMWIFTASKLQTFTDFQTKQLHTKIEQLEAKVAMLNEALKYCIDDLVIRAKLNDDDALNIGQGCLDQMHQAFNATSADYEAYRNKMRRDHYADALYIVDTEGKEQLAKEIVKMSEQLEGGKE